MSLVEGLVRDYGDFKIEIPRWEIPDQGITALWGPSGSGKTSVFRLLIGLEPCPTLVWKFAGEDLAQLSPPERRLGVVFQSLELFPHMSAEENILFAARARGIQHQEAVHRLRDISDELRMSAYLGRMARVLSGGEAQRVALARAVREGPANRRAAAPLPPVRRVRLPQPHSRSRSAPHVAQYLRATTRRMPKPPGRAGSRRMPAETTALRHRP